jgi:hypothetical protein
MFHDLPGLLKLFTYTSFSLSRTDRTILSNTSRWD